MSCRITISHPHGSLNSYHAAAAFAFVGQLSTFELGITSNGTMSGLLANLHGSLSKIQQRDYKKVPNCQQREHLIWETFSRAGRLIKSKGPTANISWYDVLFCGHDWQVAKTLAEDIGAVYAYEDGALRTFTAARQISLTTIYELPAGYYAGAEQELMRVREERPDFNVEIKIEPEWKRRRKDRELDLARLVVVPCKWAADTLRFSKVYKEKQIIKIPYGTPADVMAAKSTCPVGPFTVLFAGQVGVRKGVPYLLEAWSQLHLKNARLLLAGGMRLDGSFMSRHGEDVEYIGMLSRADLLEVMKKVDLFVFPSLADGFGMVIGEAMAAGTPVLTTHNTGGPELITNGQEGWCVPAHDVQALAERLEWAYLHRQELFEMGRLARIRAESWSWSRYGERLVKELTPHLSGDNVACLGQYV